jgi:histidine ammonia-lyase
MQEDHVSMSWGAARKLRTSVANLRRILAVELICATRGLESRAPLKPAPATTAALHALRARVPGAGPDRFLSPELAAAEESIHSGGIVEAVQSVVGALA